jgi:hypothetical protein
LSYTTPSCPNADMTSHVIIPKAYTSLSLEYIPAFIASIGSLGINLTKSKLTSSFATIGKQKLRFYVLKRKSAYMYIHFKSNTGY